MKPRSEAIWRHWAGVSDPGSAAKEGLDSLDSRLFSPPSENYIGDGGAFRTAHVDAAFHELAKKQGVTPKPFWPENRPYAICITHDIDRILASIHALKTSRRLDWSVLRRVGRDIETTVVPALRAQNPYFNFQRMSRLESEWGVRSASYVLFEKRRWLKALFSAEPQHAIGVYRPASIFNELGAYEQMGNEVGIHGSFDSWADADALQKEVRQLRAGGIENIAGARNHYLHFDPERTLPAQSKAGLQYDSTMGFNYRSGFRSGTSFPFRWAGQWELPFQLMDSALRYEFPDPADRLKHALSVRDEVRKWGGVLVLNWHLHIMNPDVFPDDLQPLERIAREAKRDGAWIALPREVIGWWQRRVESA